MTSEEDLKLLAGCFIKLPNDEEEMSQREGQPLELIDAIDVPAKLRQFVEDQRRAKGEQTRAAPRRVPLAPLLPARRFSPRAAASPPARRITTRRFSPGCALPRPVPC